MTTRQKNRLRKLLTASISSGSLGPALADKASEYLVTGTVASVSETRTDTRIDYAVWLALAWATAMTYDKECVSIAIGQLSKTLRKEGITV
jgi:hypothetical protein